MKYLFSFIFLMSILFNSSLKGQGVNHNFLLGYLDSAWLPYSPSPDAVFQFTDTTATILPQVRIMRFNASQANISDSIGNLLFYSNGGWIANINGDTMLNGTNINPSVYTSVNADLGFRVPSMQLILQWPDSANKFVMFHQTISDYSGSKCDNLFYSVVDMSLDSGRGGVISNRKNLIAINDTICSGIAACKHANGRDWWVAVLKDSSDIICTLLLTPHGITNVGWQHLNTPFHRNFISAPMFSPDGNKFAFTLSKATGNSINPYIRHLRLFDFDRCSGLFSNPINLNLKDTFLGIGLCFSPNSRYLYTSKFIKISQFDLQAPNLMASRQIVAEYDTFYNGGYTDFGNMYLAANGKIYLSSSGTTIYFNVINSPDSAGLSCDVQQHSIQTPCYIYQSHVNHPNYYLGRLQGSPCDTLQWTGIEETQHDFRFRIYPNPISNNILNIGYLLPQNKSGTFHIYDVTGKIVFKYNLPQWSNEQSFNLPKLSNGIYQCVLKSDNHIATKKLIVIKE